MSAEKLLSLVKNNEYQELASRLTPENDEDVNIKDGEGWTLLHYAVINGNSDLVIVLLKNGADPTEVTNDGDTPLHIACRKGSKDIVNILLKHGSICKINYTENRTTHHGDTPLHTAAKNGFTDIVKSLLSNGAIYDIKNNDNQTPLDLSKAFSVTKILRSIQESFEKAKQGDMEIINMLKEASVDEFSAIINARNSKNQPLIHVAMINHQHTLTAKLLEISVDIDSHFNNKDRLTPEESPPDAVKEKSTKEKLEELKYFAENHLTFSDICLPILRNISHPHGTDKNPNPWKTVKEGSYLLGNAQHLIDLYKEYMLGKIEDENIRQVADTLLYFQFDNCHISSVYTSEAYGGDAKCFVSKGQGTVYYNMLHSDLNEDVRVFIGIIEKNLDTPIKRFLDTINQKLKLCS